MTVKDSYSEIEGAAKRWYRRHKDKVTADGLCIRCNRKLDKHDTRISWKDGERKVVKRRTCLGCQEKIVARKLYPTKEGV